MKIIRWLAFMFSALFLFAISAEAATVRISQAKLGAMKINIVKFGIIHLSKDGRVVIAYEKMSDTKLKEKGYAYKLWVFDLSGKTRDTLKTSEILLPCAALQNAAISHDGKTAVITAERGSKFIKVDIPNKKATVLFEHKKGIPGFRCDTGVIQTYPDGKIAASGYFYDKTDKATYKAVASINYTKTEPKDIFTSLWNTTRFEKNIGDKAKYVEWVDAGQCFWIGRIGTTKGDESLCFYNRGKSTVIDTAPMYLHFAAGKNRIIYTSAQKATAVEGDVPSYEGLETIVATVNIKPNSLDATAEEKIKVNEDGKLYKYLAMSKDGNTAIMSDLNLKSKSVSYYYGKAADKFKMKPITSQANIPLSQLRLSPDGKAFVTWDGTQIVWGELE